MESGYDHPLHCDPYITNDVKCAACRVDPYNEKLLSDHTCSKYSRSSEDRASAYTFDNYQDDAGTTAIYPDFGQGSSVALCYLALKLNGEAGEVGEAYAKFLRGDYDLKEGQRRIRNELGDVLWYVSQLAYELNISLSDVAAENIRKLNDRKHRGVIRGSGDDR